MRRQGSSKEKIKTVRFGFRTEGNSRERRCSSIFAAPFLLSTPAFLGYPWPMQVLQRPGAA
jgi:hypothetical protein